MPVRTHTASMAAWRPATFVCPSCGTRTDIEVRARGSAETLNARQSERVAVKQLARDVERLVPLFQCPACRYVDLKGRKKYRAWLATALITGLAIGGAVWMMAWGAGHMMRESDQAKVPWFGLCFLLVTVALSLFFSWLSAGPETNLDDRFRVKQPTR